MWLWPPLCFFLHFVGPSCVPAGKVLIVCFRIEPLWLNTLLSSSPSSDVACFRFFRFHCFHKTLVFTEHFICAICVSWVLLLSQFWPDWIAPICALSGSGPLAPLYLRLLQCQQSPNDIMSVWIYDSIVCQPCMAVVSCVFQILPDCLHYKAQTLSS